MSNTTDLVPQGNVASRNLVTVDQFAAMENVSGMTIRTFIHKHNIEPVIPAKAKGKNSPAEYDLDILCSKQEEEEEELALKKQETSASKLIARTDEGVIQRAVRQRLESIEKNVDTEEASQEALGVAAMMLQTLARLQERFALEKEELKVQLDLSKNVFTCETYAVTVLGYPITAKQAGAITRRMKSKGYLPEGVIPAQGGRYPVHTWRKMDLERFDDMFWAFIIEGEYDENRKILPSP
jgi:hypothetical protein